MLVLVFRAAEAAAKTAAALRDAGHAALLAPVTEIVGRLGATPAGRFDAILATSAKVFMAQGANALDALLRLPVFAVGGATREAAREAGFKDTRMAAGDGLAAGDGGSLASLVRLTLPRPARLLYLGAHDRKADLETSLVAAGYAVETVVAYEAAALDAWPPEVMSSLRDGIVDAALHYSRRSAELAWTMARRHDRAAEFIALDHCCLSEDVAAPLRQAGASRIRVAKTPTEAALLTSLALPP